MNRLSQATRTFFSRRRFVGSLAALLAALGLKGTAQASPGRFSARAAAGKLAIDGGTPAVTRRLPPPVRWGDLERGQLNEMLKQSSLFYWQGERTQLAIERFKRHYPLEWVQTCSSGTAAIHIACAAAGIGPGDEVITTPVTDMGTVIGILYQQAVPVFADLVADTYNLDPGDVERKITPRTKAIMVVHLMGNPCEMDEINAIADRHDLIVIEDAAQAWGSLYKGRPVGTLGHIGCWSLQNSKHITCGDGGIVASGDPRFGPLLQKFGDKGYDRVERPETVEVLAGNYRMSEPQAAVTAAQMERLDFVTTHRARLGDIIGEEIKGLPGILPHNVNRSRGDLCTYWFYMWRIDPAKLSCDSETFLPALRAEGVRASGGYISAPIYRYSLFENHAFFAGRWPIKEMGLTETDYGKVSCPEAEAILRTSFRFRPDTNMDEDYCLSVGAAIRKVAEHYAV